MRRRKLEKDICYVFCCFGGCVLREGVSWGRRWEEWVFLFCVGVRRVGSMGSEFGFIMRGSFFYFRLFGFIFKNYEKLWNGCKKRYGRLWVL